MKSQRNMNAACIWLVALVSGLGTATTVSASAITYTFTAIGSGTIGTTSFTGDLVTVTAIGDTGAVFEAPQPPFPPDVFAIVPTQFEVSISGVGTAGFTGTGYFGGNGYVFDNEGDSLAGFGIESDAADISNLAFATYDLSSSIGPISGVSMGFSAEATTLGALTLTTVTPGTFTAELGSSVPEPITAGMVALALAVAALIRRKRISA